MTKREKLFLFGSLVIVIAVVVVIAAPFARKKAEAIGCGNTMIPICFAARYWWAEEDHDGFMPSNLTQMSNELATPKFLVCPGDYSRHAATNWASITSSNISYEIVNTGLRAGDTNGVFLRCKVHGFFGYADGSVYDRKRKLKKRP